MTWHPVFSIILFSTALWNLANSRPIRFPMLSSHLFLCLPCLLPLFTVPCQMVLARPDEREACPYHFSLHLFTMVSTWRSSCDQIGTDILVGNSYGLCMRCVVSCSSTSFPWLVSASLQLYCESPWFASIQEGRCDKGSTMTGAFLAVSRYDWLCAFLLLLLLSVERPQPSSWLFLSLMVRAGYVCVAIIHQTLTWTTGSSSCVQMLMHVIEHRGVRTPKESLHWKLTLGRKSRAAPVNRTCVKGVTVRRSNPLSCIPSHHTHSACHQWPL